MIAIAVISPAAATKELQILCEEGFIARRELTSRPRTYYIEMN